MTANGEVGALRVSLTLDSADFTQRISDVNARLQSVRSEFNAASDGTRGFANTLDGTRAKIDNVTRQIELQQAKVQALRARYQEVAAAQGENSNAALRLSAQYNNAVGALNRLDTQLSEAQTRLANFNAEAARGNSVWGRMQSQMQGVSQRMQDMGSKLKDVGMNLAMAFGGAALAIGKPLEDAIKTGAEFESTMAGVGAKAGANADELKKLSNAAIGFAPLAGGATNAATAMDDLAAKGYSVNKIIQAMPGILNAANASGEDLALTSDTITSALESFHMQADQTSHVADVLAQTSNLTAAGMQDLRYTFQYAAPVANQLGISMEQLASMTGIMANQGIRGEAAGTALREAMLRLANPPKEAANELKNLGVKVTDNTGKFRSFSDIIGDLNNSTAKMTNAQKTAALGAIFGTNAVSGMMAVISGGKQKIDDFTNSLVKSDGASKKAANAMQNNFAGSMKKLNGAIDAAKIGIEQALAPSLMKLAGVAEKVVTAFNNLSPGMKQTIAIGAAVSTVLLGIVAAFGGLGFLIGSAMEAFGTLGGILFGTAESAGFLATAFTFMTGPIGIAIAAIVGIGIGLVTLFNKNKAFHDAVVNLWDAIAARIKQFGDWITPYVKQFLQAVSDIWNQVWPVLQKVLSDFLDGFIGTIKVITDIINGDWKKDWDAFKNVITTAIDDAKNAMKQKLTEWKNDIANWFTEQKTTITTKLSEWTTGIADWFNSIPSVIRSKLSQWKDALVQWAKEQNQENIRQFSEWGNDIQKWFSSIPSVISAKLTEWKNSIVNGFTQMKTDISTKLSEWTTSIQNWFTSIPSNMESWFNGWKQGIGQGFINAKNEITNQLNSWYQTIKDWFTSLASKPEVKNSGRDMVKKVKEGMDGQKKDFMDHLGGYIVDGFTYALEFAGIVIASVARELIKRFINSVQSAMTGLKQTISDGVSNAFNTLRNIDLSSIGSGIIQGLINGIKSAAGGVGKAIQGIAGSIGSTFNSAMSALHVPGFASGTNYAPGGLSLVGEQGVELVNLPKGSKVIPHNQTMQLLKSMGSGSAAKGNSPINITVNTNSVNMNENQLLRTFQRAEALYGF